VPTFLHGFSGALVGIFGGYFVRGNGVSKVQGCNWSTRIKMRCDYVLFVVG